MMIRKTSAVPIRLAAFVALLAAAAPILRGQETRTVYRVPVTGTVEMGLAPFVSRALDEAAEAGAAAVVLDIDTPGGRIDAAWEIIDAVRDSRVPVHAYVNRRALSAGAMIALSADGLYMRPGSTIGAATPVVGDGKRASEKMVSAMRSEFRALAEERGFDPAIAEAMVDEKVVVEGISEAGRLLTLTTTEALESGVANAEVEDWPDLVGALGLAGAPVEEIGPNWAERIVRLLTNPMLAPLLLSLGFLGLVVEIRTPTFGLAGAVGLICLTAFFGARFLVNLAGMEEFILLAVGAGLIGLEVFVIPGFGVAGLAGGVAVLTALMLSMLGSYPTVAEVISALGIIAVSILVVGVLAYAVLRHLPFSRAMSGVLLDRATTQEAGYLSAPDRPDLEGRIGEALTDLRPSGTVGIAGERIDVVTEGPWVEKGETVVILRAESYRHVVRKAEPG
ncbi:MAG: ATP-dependent Clp protease proteolytic subunit, partial [Gemmatimonadetes bacterium]|nr:ATP-dependent Clp protease proteolytic subunit [Gemmatimonadota bacterium]